MNLDHKCQSRRHKVIIKLAIAEHIKKILDIRILKFTQKEISDLLKHKTKFQMLGLQI